MPLRGDPLMPPVRESADAFDGAEPEPGLRLADADLR
jgi:hypothetical protein